MGIGSIRGIGTFYPNRPRTVRGCAGDPTTLTRERDVGRQADRADVTVLGPGQARARRVAQHADEVDAPDRLAREGDRAYEFFVLLAGTADVDSAARSRTSSARTTFGEIGWVKDDARHIASEIARTATRIAEPPALRTAA
jgi:hypothetical protein